jgi:hypothetical protein
MLIPKAIIETIKLIYANLPELLTSFSKRLYHFRLSLTFLQFYEIQYLANYYHEFTLDI